MWSIHPQQAISRIVVFLLNGPGTWPQRTIEEALRFFLHNYVPRRYHTTRTDPRG